MKFNEKKAKTIIYHFIPTQISIFIQRQFVVFPSFSAARLFRLA